jgi:hypothetical protein
MTNLAVSPVFTESNITTVDPPIKKVNRKSDELSSEDEQIISALHTVKSDLDILHNRYDQTTDPLLLESVIYELKAANLKFMYYLNLCKDRGIVCRTVSGR